MERATTPASNPAKRLAAVSRPTVLRSLLQVVNDNTKRNRRELLPAVPMKPLTVQPNVDFEEVSRILQLAKQTLQEEHARILSLKERISRLRGFEDAYFKNRETIEELRVDRDQWRKQAIAMSNYLLSAEQLP